MKVLIACEESQRVCLAFRQLGHEAYSCDIIDCSGSHPEFHIKQDVIPLLNGFCKFKTMDDIEHQINSKWDLIIAHPPCTYLTVSGNRWYNVEKYGEKALKRIQDRKLAKQFFMSFINADCEKIAVQNPIGIMSTQYRKPDQIIQPYQFGHPDKKATCLWLKNLPLLKPTNIVQPHKDIILKNGKKDTYWHYATSCLSKKERSQIRSKTFIGIAKAMASQWG